MLSGGVVLIMLFGLALAALGNTPLFALLNDPVNEAMWGGLPPEEGVAMRGFDYGMLGATMAGWGLTLWFVVAIPFRQRHVWAWNAVLFSVLLWFVVNTAVSTYYGIWSNAVFNTFILVLMVVPLWKLRGEFKR